MAIHLLYRLSDDVSALPFFSGNLAFRRNPSATAKSCNLRIIVLCSSDILSEEQSRKDHPRVRPAHNQRSRKQPKIPIFSVWAKFRASAGRSFVTVAWAGVKSGVE